MMTHDETKRHENLQKHGIDLAECECIFDEGISFGIICASKTSLNQGLIDLP
jgi:uncharacterized DUF497 family protein